MNEKNAKYVQQQQHQHQQLLLSKESGAGKLSCHLRQFAARCSRQEIVQQHQQPQNRSVPGSASESSI